MFEHWNGQHWSIVKSPTPGGLQSLLNGVVALSANDIWAVGGSDSGGGKYPNLTLIEHWNGQHWSIIPSPSNAKSVLNSLSSVTAVTASDVWAVGYSPNIYPQQGQTLVEHWDGMQWRIIPSPSPGGAHSNYLNGVTQVPRSSKIWAVGFIGSGFAPDQTLTEVWGS